MSPGANLPDRIAVAAEVYRALIMEGIVDEDRDLEVDSRCKLQSLRIQFFICLYEILLIKSSTILIATCFTFIA